ncbi:basic proline-rich protein-like [Delphinapterus leucas]|uniref:Basic proline-rich protein-like n=1 Tax=Delphinapterus leucas TaxID=9749 RepID=A0A2Y9PVY6_DELLE|nr:basic proline-rich protein-like [Delphinapterus leucas]
MLNSVEKEKVGGSPERGAQRRSWDPAQKFPPNCGPARHRQGQGRGPKPRRPRPPATWGVALPAAASSPIPACPGPRGSAASPRPGGAPRGLCVRPRPPAQTAVRPSPARSPGAGMKVTVRLGRTGTVVPCKEGQMRVRELTQQALQRYLKTREKGKRNQKL